MIDNVTRRDLLKLAAAGSLPLIAPRIAWGQPAPPIVKPLPPEWFVVHGTNAEMRWEAARRLGHLIPASGSSSATTRARPASIPRRGG